MKTTENEQSTSLDPLGRRRAVAIAMARTENNYATQCNYVTTALCNDGTMWSIRDNDTEWREMPGIPQPPNDQVELPPKGSSESKNGVVGG